MKTDACLYRPLLVCMCVRFPVCERLIEKALTRKEDVEIMDVINVG